MQRNGKDATPLPVQNGGSPQPVKHSSFYFCKEQEIKTGCCLFCQWQNQKQRNVKNQNRYPAYSEAIQTSQPMLYYSN